MLDSEEVYQMTKHKMDAAQIATAKRIHINLVLVKLLELHHLGYDLQHYHFPVSFCAVIPLTPGLPILRFFTEKGPPVSV